jgi:hypothetical protein
MPLSTYRQAFVAMNSVNDDRLMDRQNKYEEVKRPGDKRPSLA